MSLKAKIEAVIYAAEEPVTLAQLSALFAVEALTERAGRREREQAEEARLAESTPALPFEDEPALEDATAGLDLADLDVAGPEGIDTASTDVESVDTATEDAGVFETAEHPEQVTLSQPDGSAEPLVAPEPEAAPVEAEGEALSSSEPGVDDEKRRERLEQREVRDEIRLQIDALMAEYDGGNRGIEIREIAGGYRIATKPEYHDAVRGFVKSLKPPMKLTLQALETLAVIAYKQPVTAPEVSEIRGVDSGGVLGSLITRKLVTTAGRKQVIGRPILYKTTKEFLLRFGLRDLAELPSMEEFEKMAGELAATEAEPLPAEQAGQMRLNTGVTPAGSDDAQENVESYPEGTDRVSNTDEETQPMSSEERVDGQGIAEPTSAEEVQAAPEVAEARTPEEIKQAARAHIVVSDEDAAEDALSEATSEPDAEPVNDEALTVPPADKH